MKQVRERWSLPPVRKWDPSAEKGLAFGGSMAISSKDGREKQAYVGKGGFHPGKLRKQILILFSFFTKTYIVLTYQTLF